jgi:D-alanine-D-alanine ligase
MSKHVAVLMGGWSAEREISLISGAAVIEALHELGHRASAVDVGRDVADVLAKLKPDICFNALHGRFGEDGAIQGMLEILGLPYTHSGVLASALAMNKPMAKRIFESHGLPVPDGGVVHRDEILAGSTNAPMTPPYVIKPLNEGSSVGVRIVMDRAEAEAARLMPWGYGENVLVERYVPGREIQVAVMGEGALGAIEIRTQGRFYDYEAKYTAGKAEHLMPAPLNRPDYEEVCRIALVAHQSLGCRGVSRTDLRCDDSTGRAHFYVLEVNTQPGMTPLSLVPEIARHQGMSFPKLVDWILGDAGCDR